MIRTPRRLRGALAALGVAATVLSGLAVMAGTGSAATTTPGFAISGSEAPVTAGVPVDVTVAATNTDGSTDTGFTGSVTFTSSDPGATLPGPYTFSEGDFGRHVFQQAVVFAAPGTPTVTVTSGGVTKTATFSVVANTATGFRVENVPNPFTAGISVPVRVRAVTSAGTTATSYTGTVALTSTDAAATGLGTHAFTAADNGVFAFPGVGLKTPGNQTLTATDSAATSVTGSTSTTVAPSSTAGFAVDVRDPSKAGQAGSVTITAEDASGATTTGYTGTVRIVSTDIGAGSATPGPVTFTAADNGSKTVSGLIFNTPGFTTLSVKDQADSTRSGSVQVNVTGPGAPTGVTAAAGSDATSAVVSFTAAPGSTDDPVSRYTVTASNGGPSVTVDGTATSATVTGLTTGTSYTFTVTALTPVGTSAASQPSAAFVPGGTPGGGGGGGGGTVPGDLFTPVTPFRLLDTRSTTALGPTETRTVPIAGVGAVPADATGVVMNVTAVLPTGSGYLTVFPGPDKPGNSTVNFPARRNVANLAEVKLGSDGAIRVFNSAGTTNIIFDVVGFYGGSAATAAGGTFTPVSPARLYDTRNAGNTPLGPAATRQVQVVGGVGGVPAGATAVVANVTAVLPTGSGYLTAFPGPTKPGSSTVNFPARTTVANAAVIPLATDGSMQVFNAAGTTNLIVDVVGYYSATTTGSRFVGVTPARITDTRATGPVQPTSTVTVATSGVGGVAAGARAVVVNLTAVLPTGSGYLTAYPADPRPGVSSVNFPARLTVANLAVVPVASDGTFKVFNSAGQTNVVVDVVGYFS